MAGLSPWGAGTIHLPPPDTMMFMPPRPYLPLGTLRGGASYPAAPERFDHASVAAALERVGLCHLLLALDREERWDKDLSLRKQQRLAFARLVLHRPSWVILGRRAQPSQRLLRPHAALPAGRGERHPSAPSPPPTSDTAPRLGSAT